MVQSFLNDHMINKEITECLYRIDINYDNNTFTLSCYRVSLENNVDINIRININASNEYVFIYLCENGYTIYLLIKIRE